MINKNKVQNKIQKIIMALFLLLLAAGGLFAAEGTATRRFGLFIGSNNGGRGRVTLRYAVSDAQSVSRVFAGMGGISKEDSVLLVEPTMTDINRQLDNLGRLSAQARRSAQRTELIFYYSGHSDENGLLLNREHYGYRELRERINSVQADMKVIILDSCSSGAITRAKGGVKTQPFLFDSSVSAEGYAFLTSSSDNEVSQESDIIESSYFTHSLLAGLRGAADSVGDGLVTLNELYRFAYTETLAKTETSVYGAQHPSYDIQISGSGDLVLTDVKEISSSLIFTEDLTGRISIRDGSDFLVAELTRAGNKPIEIGLEPGLYRLILQQGNNFYRTEILLSENQRATLNMRNFTQIAAASGDRRRGEDSEEPNEGSENKSRSLYTFFFNNVDEDFHAPIIGFVNIARGNFKTAEIGFINWNTQNLIGPQLGFVNTIGHDLDGVQAGFVNTAFGNIYGWQTAFINTARTVNGVQSGFVNTAFNDLYGWQGGFVNTAREIKGAQTGFVNTAFSGGQGAQAGFVNVSVKKLRGMQIGFVNYADSIEDGIPIGFLSIVREGGYHAIEYSFSEYMPFNLAFKIGVEKFYTTFNAAINPFNEPGTKAFAFGLGMGSIIPIGNLFYFNPEFSHLNVYKLREIDVRKDEWNMWEENTNILTFAPYFGFNIFKNFSIFAGPSVSWAYNYGGKNKAEPFFAIYNHEINDKHSIVVGARVGLRVKF